MSQSHEILCSRCGIRPATVHVCTGDSNGITEAKDLCRACYEAIAPGELLPAEKKRDEALQAMLSGGKCMFCGGPAVGGGVFPGGVLAVEHPESRLWCKACIQYFEEFKARPENQIHEEIPSDPNDEAAWAPINENIRSWFARLELFIRQRVSKQQ